MSLIHTAVHRSRTVFLLLALIFFAGIGAYMAIPKESAPDVPVPIIYVSMVHEGISPEDAVEMLVKPIEQEVRSIEGLDELEATAYEGGANLVLYFKAGFDNDQALEDVRNKVDLAKPELPDETEEPIVKEVNISLAPVLTVILSGQMPERALKRLAEDLQDRIEGLSGVLEANIRGVREEQLLVEIDRTKLESYGIAPARALDIIRMNNQLIAAGSLEFEHGRYAIKVPGLFSEASEVLDLPIATNGTRTVRIRDIGDVKLTFKDQTSAARVDGEQAVTLDVSKRIGENVIETVDAVKAIVARSHEEWPAGIDYAYTSDESQKIRRMLSDLQNNVAISVLLVMVVVLLALGGGQASLVALTIPGSFLLAITTLHALGLTMNIVVLFSLILAVGMLVDGAIVVTELADVQLAQGKKRKQAFIYAAQYMAWPIIASTATTLAAFLPLLFWSDIVGEFMKFLPITFIFTLTASLIMALIFLPTIGGHLKWLKTTTLPEPGPVAKRYGKMLEKALGRPWKVLGLATATFVGVIILYGMVGRGVEFFPNVEPEEGFVEIYAKGDLSITEKDRIVQQVEERLLDLDGVRTVYVTVGEGADRNQQGPSDMIGNIFLDYVDWENGRPTSDDILAEAKKRTADIYGVDIRTNTQRSGPSQGKPIQIVVTGPRFDILPPVVTEIKNILADIPGTTNIDDDLPDPGIEWALKVDRAEAVKAGTNLAEVGTTLRLATGGVIIDTYRDKSSNEEIDIVGRFKPEQRYLDVLEDLKINTADGNQVPISNFTTRTPQPKVTVINRLDQNNSVTVDADVQKGFLADTIVQKLKAKAPELVLPRGVEIQFKGDDEDQKEAAAFLQRAFMIAVFIMAIILVTQFNSYYQAFVILAAVVFSTTGVLLGHILIAKPFGIVMGGIGVISLAGIVVNNNIVLIDTFNKLKAEMPWKEALIETGIQRLRPVLLTAITTIIGLLPMATKVNINLVERTVGYNAPSSQWWDQLASAIVFGLAFATLLTLVVTPCMLALQERRKDA